MGERRHVLITGAGSGIGFEAALLFARQGWSVTATLRSADRASALNEALAREALDVTLIAFDLADRGETGAAVEALRAGDAPDVLVNNAGLAVYGPIELADERSIALQFEVNVFAPLRLIRALAPKMRERKSGAIINVGSVSGFVAQQFDGLYAASKHALEAVSESLHHELKPFGVRVALIEPGRVNTPIKDKIGFVHGFAPGSDYWPHFEKWQALLNETLWAGGWAEDPKVVARAIWEAATTDEPKLRWLVGRDAELIGSLRGRDAVAAFEPRLKAALKAQAVA